MGEVNACDRIKWMLKFGLPILNSWERSQRYRKEEGDFYHCNAMYNNKLYVKDIVKKLFQVLNIIEINLSITVKCKLRYQST